MQLLEHLEKKMASEGFEFLLELAALRKNPSLEGAKELKHKFIPPKASETGNKFELNLKDEAQRTKFKTAFDAAAKKGDLTKLCDSFKSVAITQLNLLLRNVLPVPSELKWVNQMAIEKKAPESKVAT